MAGGFWSGLGKLVNAGTAYAQHVNFANRALAAAQGEAGRQLQGYTRGLSDASFAGLKVTLTMMASQEQDPARKAGLQRLLASADTARRGEPLPAAPAPAQALASAHHATFDDDVTRVANWYDDLDGPGQERALVEHVHALSLAGYQSFTAHMKQMIDNVDSNILAHAKAEDQAWGGSFEDRMAYGMARLETGQRDPAWQRKMRSLQDVRAFFSAVLEAAHRLWSERQQGQQTPAAPPRRSAPAAPPPAIERQPTMSKSPAPTAGKPDPKSVLANVKALVSTGQYPGGAEKMQADIAALVLAGQADEVMDFLKSFGAMDVGSKPMVIEDHYVDGPDPYTLRWPIQFPLPIPFDELPRQTQFSVLFGEWSRREMEGGYAMSQGQNDAARDAYQECLERAQQITVPELVARSHEGLARLASKLNDRALERKHLKAAIAARAGG